MQQRNSQHEESIQHEMDVFKLKYAEMLDCMKSKVDVLENYRTEYSAAIKVFLFKNIFISFNIVSIVSDYLHFINYMFFNA